MTTPEHDEVIAQAHALRRDAINAITVAQDPELMYPDLAPDEFPTAFIEQWERESGRKYHAHLETHRDVLEPHPDFQHAYELHDWLHEKGADFQDFQTWTGDPEEPLRRSDRRRSR
ncbi:hypothetical protein [Nocardia cyriacigeorgica]|uniref:hypothetical protein n=1 Tax=Nocardia cyriacigeorgica TaxID=135487 RepID=UPI002454FDD8|nr:hypothetical protein [Nocardia cyriacigeorgica]